MAMLVLAGSEDVLPVEVDEFEQRFRARVDQACARILASVGLKPDAVPLRPAPVQDDGRSGHDRIMRMLADLNLGFDDEPLAFPDDMPLSDTRRTPDHEEFQRELAVLNFYDEPPRHVEPDAPAGAGSAASDGPPAAKAGGKGAPKPGGAKAKPTVGKTKSVPDRVPAPSATITKLPVGKAKAKGTKGATPAAKPTKAPAPRPRGGRKAS